MKHTLLSCLLLFPAMLFAQRIELGEVRPIPFQEDRYDDDLSDEVIFYEGFENAPISGLPQEWSTSGIGDAGFQAGTAGTAAGQTNENGFWNVPLHGIFALTNDDVCNCDKSEDLLIAPAINLKGAGRVVLRFSAYQDGSAGQIASVEIRTTNLPWTAVDTIPSGASWKTYQLSIPNGFLDEGFQFRFRYNDQGNYASGLAIDDVYLYKSQADRFALEQLYTVQGNKEGSGQLYHSMPLSQARSARLQFGIRVVNESSQRKNAKLAMEINGPLSWSDTSASWSMSARQSSTISFDAPERFTPYLVGSYSLSGNLITDSTDLDLSDNTYNTDLGVADTVYSRTAIPKKNTAGIWLENQGDRYGAGFEFFVRDTLRAIKVRIHPSTEVGARMRFKIFHYDTLTSSSYSSSPITVTANDIGKSMRIPLNIPIHPGRQLLAIEKEAGAERLVIGVSTSVEAIDRNSLTREAPGGWTSFPFFPLIEAVLAPINEQCPGHIQYSVSDESCVGAEDGSISTSVIDANPPFIYNWSNGAGNVSDLDDLAPGFYDLFVTDDLNCIYEVNFEIKAADTIQFDPIITLDTCGRSSGAIDLNIQGGNAPFTILWNGSTQSAKENGLSLGSYSIELTDENGCTGSTQVTVGGTEDIGIAFSVTNSDCLDSNGVAEIIPFGTGPFQYSWSIGDSTTIIDSLKAGVYDVTLTDSLGCQTTGRAFINDNNSPSIVIDQASPIQCYGTQDGTIETSISGGTAPYDFAWSNGDTNADITGLDAGVYYLSVSDASGCRSFTSVIVDDEATPITIDVNDRGNYCAGDSQGIAELIVNGGALPYSYEWSTGFQGSEHQNLMAGTYFYSITDDNGCTYSDSIHIQDGVAFNISIDTIFWDTIENFKDENQIYIEAIGGIPPLNFLWNDSIPGKDLINVPTGPYYLVASDQLGCSKTLDYFLENGPTGISPRFQRLEPKVELFPNPLKEGETLHLRTNQPIERIRVFSLTGELLVESQGTLQNSQELKMNGLSSGIFLIRIITPSGSTSQRFSVFH